jgi:hypothetical protein
MEEKEYKTGTFKMGRCDIIISIDEGLWHLSISTKYNSPSYKEIKEARYKYIPDNILMAQLFPSKTQFVNYHPYCHHLWQIRDSVKENREAQETCSKNIRNAMGKRIDDIKKSFINLSSFKYLHK